MLIKITEHNAWENERWTYVLDLEKQEAAAISYLMLFIPLANKLYDEAKKSAPENTFARSLGIFGRHMPKVFAASRYSFDFFDRLEGDTLISKRFSLNVGKGGNYKSNSLDLNQKISVRKMKSAFISMRDKEQNVLYKSFEGIFHVKKLKSGT